MNRRAIVSTHHKTGTVWMSSTFKGICRDFNIPLITVHKRHVKTEEMHAPCVIFDPHSQWASAMTEGEKTPEDRIFHLIRDPRDVVISAMHYHRKSSEKWLHVPNKKFGGKTYQEMTNSLADDHARMLFEMDNSAGRVAEAIRDWNYHRPESFECKYEDLMADTQMELFTTIATHLGFSGEELDLCREHFWHRSLFSERPAEKNPDHIRSGGSEQWRGVFDRDLGEAFVERFGNVLIETGYEKDNGWLEQLRDTPEAAARRQEIAEERAAKKAERLRQKKAARAARVAAERAEKQKLKKAAKAAEAAEKKAALKAEKQRAKQALIDANAQSLDAAMAGGAVVLANAHPGSINLVTLLNSHPDFHFHGEIYSPKAILSFQGQHNIERRLGLDFEKLREEDPERFMALAFSHPLGKYHVRGFKLLNEHNAAVLKTVIERPAIKLIVQRSTNLLATFSSVASGGKNPKSAKSGGKLTFHRIDFDVYQERIARRFAQIDKMLEDRPNVMRVDTADAGKPDVHAQMVDFLGGRRDVKLKMNPERQNASRVIDRFANQADVIRYLEKHKKPQWAERG